MQTGMANTVAAIRVLFGFQLPVVASCAGLLL